jgi:hypothetical protein
VEIDAGSVSNNSRTQETLRVSHDNPLYNAAGKQLNVDSRYLRDQAWVRATLSF